MVPTGQVLRWAIPAFSVQPCHGKAGEGTRTLDIQLGKLTTHHENDRESGILEGSSETPRSTHSSTGAKQRESARRRATNVVARRHRPMRATTCATGAKANARDLMRPRARKRVKGLEPSTFSLGS